MTDPLDRMKAAMQAAPAPDADAKARILAAAEKSFDDFQGSPDGLRPTHDRPVDAPGFWERIGHMFTNFGLRPALMATTSIAVIGVAFVLTRQPLTLDVTGGIPEATPSVEPAKEQAEVANRVLRDGLAGIVGASDLAVSDEIGNGAPLYAEAPIIMSEPAPAMAPLATRRMAKAVAPAAELDDTFVMPEANTEQFPDAEPNGLKITSESPVSTFSVDVDTTSYSLMRMAIEDGYPLPQEAVRIEELINYFDYDYPMPDSIDTPFSISANVMATPWNPDTRLMQIALQGYDVPKAERPPMGLVFLIDTSGSMNDPKKLPLLIKSFNLLLNQLNEDDSIAIVTYAGNAGTLLEPTPASDRDAIRKALAQLTAGGSTAGQSGLEHAYALAEDMAEGDRQARVVLATDGDFNVGLSDAAGMTDYIADKRDSGTYLSVLGFGRGNYNDTMMQALAQNGNGVAAYIDSLAEAEKVLVRDLTGALMTIATDVKIQVEFNPAMVSEYRLIGYETRALQREDFNNDAVDAGDIGAGHTVTAIYEITPKGSPAELVDSLRYQADAAVTSGEEYAFVKLRHKKPGADESVLQTLPVTAETAQIAASEANFAAAVAGAGRLMRGEELGDWSIGDAGALAAANTGMDEFGDRAEFVRMMRLLDASQE